MRRAASSPTHRSSPPPLSVKVMLHDTTVPAGPPIKGVAIVRNATDHGLVIADCDGIWIQVGLTNTRVRYRPAWPDCLTFTTLPTGTTRVPIRVDTTYGGCARIAVGRLPACHRTSDGPRMPPLPPGRYVTKAVMLAPKGVRIPTPATIQVTITSSRNGR